MGGSGEFFAGSPFGLPRLYFGGDVPRTNVDDRWDIDPRRLALAEKLGDTDTADGAARRFWRLAQDFPGGVLPVELYDISRRSKEFEEAHLAERVEGGVYIKGSKNYHAWLGSRRAAGHLGGLSRSPEKLKHLKQNRSTSEARATVARSIVRSKTEASSSSSSSEEERRREPRAERISLSADFHWLNVSDEHRKGWKESFPAVDLEVELSKAANYIRANPSKKKKNYERYLFNWLNRSQERGGARRQPQTEIAFEDA